MWLKQGGREERLKEGNPEWVRCINTHTIQGNRSQPPSPKPLFEITNTLLIAITTYFPKMKFVSVGNIRI